MNLTKRRIAVTALFVLVAVSGTAASASAEEITEGAEIYCAVEAIALDSQRQAPPTICFDDKESVVKYLDMIGVTGVESRGVLGSIILGTAYKDANGGGSSFTFWGSSGCYGVVFGFASLPSGWDNSISSAGGSNGCWVTLYSATNYGGSRLNCTPWCGSVYGLNDNVRSIVFRPTGTFG